MLQESVDWLLYNVLNLDAQNRIISTFNYFIYDSMKIVLLLFFMIFVLGILRSYIPETKIKRLVEKGKYGTGNFIASIFGAVTPFCSCSSIPIFISFLKAGVPLGVSFSFLITSPLVNEYLVVVMLGLFGWKITLAYVISGILIGVIAGLVLGKMKLERHIVDDILKSKNVKKEAERKYPDFKSRLRFGFDEASSITKKLWLWILLGVAVGALIHNYVPEELIHNVLMNLGFFAVPIAVIIGVPIYGSCAAIVPIAVALFGKGVPLGTALAFMMAVAALSLPEAIILRRAIRLKLILIFFGVVALAIVITGYLFNMLQMFLV